MNAKKPRISPAEADNIRSALADHLTAADRDLRDLEAMMKTDGEAEAVAFLKRHMNAGIIEDPGYHDRMATAMAYARGALSGARRNLADDDVSTAVVATLDVQHAVAQAAKAALGLTASTPQEWRSKGGANRHKALDHFKRQVKEAWDEWQALPDPASRYASASAFAVDWHAKQDAVPGGPGYVRDPRTISKWATSWAQERKPLA